MVRDRPDAAGVSSEENSSVARPASYDERQASLWGGGAGR